ncbi:MAG: C45 family peptidase [Rhodospirillales bacterium]
MALTFRAVAEDEPGEVWADLFRTHWPAYKAWYLSEGLERRATYMACLDKLNRHLPKLVPTYEKLCELAGGGDLAARFLSLWRPPAYISGCSQMVWLGNRPLLVRNYDYDPRLMDGVILRSAWNGRTVVAMTDCLWGVLDGINDAGLAISLTFGGRRAVGPGFGIPIILRQILEFCETTAQATEVLQRVPTHMAYNVTVVDRHARFSTAYLSPDRNPVIRPIAYATNHQGNVEWHDHARATATLEREQFLKFRLQDDKLSEKALIDAFAKPPLYTRAYERGFGTLYTAVYDPLACRATYIWPGAQKSFSTREFEPTEQHIDFASH